MMKKKEWIIDAILLCFVVVGIFTIGFITIRLWGLNPAVITLSLQSTPMCLMVSGILLGIVLLAIWFFARKNISSAIMEKLLLVPFCLIILSVLFHLVNNLFFT